MTDPYHGREQTKAKHFILKRYLQALAFKILTFKDIAYVDGFSGPWETKTEDFSDSSFKIAIDVLKDAQSKLQGTKRKIRCFFVEKDAKAFSKLQKAVLPFHQPDDGFEVATYHGEFVSAVTDINGFIGNSFPLIFIDPTGWTGFPLDEIKPLFQKARCEVLINFMYDHINRFVHSDDEKTVASLNGILGGPGWRNRLDSTLPRGEAVEKLFRESLKRAGNFKYVVSARIDKPTLDRPHFFITYGTKVDHGLKAFRDTQCAALYEQAKNRSVAKEKFREESSRTPDLFAGHDAQTQQNSVDTKVTVECELASKFLLEALRHEGPLKFDMVVSEILQEFILRETNVKDICVGLANENKIERTWGKGNRKPDSSTVIKLIA